MNQITKTSTKSVKPLIKKTPVIIGLTLLVAGIGVYALQTFNSSESEPEAVPVTVMPEIKTVTALGRLEPSGEIITVSVSSSSEGNRIEEMLAQEGDEIAREQVIAVLDSRDRLEAALNQAQEQVKVAQANLDLVKAGAKTGEIQAQEAAIARVEAERSNDILAQNATLSRIKAELNTCDCTS